MHATAASSRTHLLRDKIVQFLLLFTDLDRILLDLIPHEVNETFFFQLCETFLDHGLRGMALFIAKLELFLRLKENFGVFDEVIRSEKLCLELSSHSQMLFLGGFFRGARIIRGGLVRCSIRKEELVIVVQDEIIDLFLDSLYRILVHIVYLLGCWNRLLLNCLLLSFFLRNLSFSLKKTSLEGFERVKVALLSG